MALTPTEYQKEQLATLTDVAAHLAGLPADARRDLDDLCAGYREFRDRVDAFLGRHFDDVCTQKCFQSRMSACCSRDGIVTFFADVVVNALAASSADISRLEQALTTPHRGEKCVYLGPAGCLWTIRPVVCAMFLCVPAQKRVFAQSAEAAEGWQALTEERNRFTWPDKPVLFDELEMLFMDAGIHSSLMYLHQSPGLLRVKRSAGLV